MIGAAPLGRRALADAGEELHRPPARVLHLGLGAFHRAHQAWYTHSAVDAAEWGIVAFTGRSVEPARRLTAQDGVYTLVQRGADADRIERIGSIVGAHAASDHSSFLRAFSDPALSVVTLTVTEAGYTLDANSEPDMGNPLLLRDLERLRRGMQDDVSTVLGRILLGLRARRAAGGGPLTIVPCDNFPRNGAVLRSAVRSLAADIDPDLARSVDADIGFVSTSVDRITPAVSPELTAEVAAMTGWVDAAPVLTEPYSDWTLSGDFAAGRPAWETAGAQFVDDIAPYESRKLLMLNGAHTLLAYRGLVRGWRTVSEAAADPVLEREMESWWNDVDSVIESTVPTVDYRAALRARFSNPRLDHSLAQISSDGLAKVRIRIVPVARQLRQRGLDARPAAGVLAAWIVAVRSGIAAADSQADVVHRALAAPDPTAALLELVDAGLAVDSTFANAVRGEIERCARARV